MNSVTELSRDALKKVRAIVEDLKVQSFEEEVKSVETILNNANLKFTFIIKVEQNHLIQQSNRYYL